MFASLYIILVSVDEPVFQECKSYIIYYSLYCILPGCVSLPSAAPKIGAAPMAATFPCTAPTLGGAKSIIMAGDADAFMPSIPTLGTAKSIMMAEPGDAMAVEAPRCSPRLRPLESVSLVMSGGK